MTADLLIPPLIKPFQFWFTMGDEIQGVFTPLSWFSGVVQEAIYRFAIPFKEASWLIYMEKENARILVL